MKPQWSLVPIALAFVVSQASGVRPTRQLAQSNMNLNPPNTAVPSANNPVIPQVTGPSYAIPPENTPPPGSDATESGTSQGPDEYRPTYQSTAPTYAIPPENTPPPTTPGENP